MLGMLLVGAAILTQGLKTRPRGAEIYVALGVAAVYLLLFTRIATPEERTHLIEYGVVAVFIYEALIERANHGRRVPMPALLAIVAASLIGLVDEGIQAFLPYSRLRRPRRTLQCPCRAHGGRGQRGPRLGAALAHQAPARLIGPAEEQFPFRVVPPASPFRQRNRCACKSRRCRQPAPDRTPWSRWHWSRLPGGREILLFRFQEMCYNWLTHWNSSKSFTVSRMGHARLSLTRNVRQSVSEEWRRSRGVMLPRR